MKVRVGTSGFSYGGWKGAFYPEKLAAPHMLGYYAERLPAVEINNSFYKTPTSALLQSWAAKVPASFHFAFKASRYFSSRRGMTDAKTPLERLFGVMDTVKDKLGPVLVQLPPPVKKDLPLLRDFLAAVPAGRRIVLEPKDPSWRSDDVCDVLRTRDVATCVTEVDGAPLAITQTARWGYFRLRKERYGGRALAVWEERLRAAGLTEAYVFFKHDEDGASAKHAVALQARFGGDV